MHQPIAGRSFRLPLSTILPLCLVAASTGLYTPTNAAALDSGIKGRVVLGPSQPSVRIGESTHERPFQATLDILAAGDESVVKQVRTRPNGTFVVGLPPGDYIVRSAASDERRQPSIDPVPVTVVPHTYVEITISADSGIR